MIGSLRFLVGHLWPMLAAGLGLGLLVGAASCATALSDALSRLAWGLWAILIGTGVAASLAGWLPGRYGLWLDVGILLLIAYAIGCALGCILRSVLGRKRGRLEQGAATP